MSLSAILYSTLNITIVAADDTQSMIIALKLSGTNMKNQPKNINESKSPATLTTSIALLRRLNGIESLTIIIRQMSEVT